MEASFWDAFFTTLLALISGIIVALVHDPVYGFLTFICIQLTAILARVSRIAS